MRTMAPAITLTAPRTYDQGRASVARPSLGPVFIQDCVQPAGGATLLLKLWQQWSDADREDEQL